MFGLPNSSPRSNLPTADDFAGLAEAALEYANPAEPVRNTRFPVTTPGRSSSGRAGGSLADTGGPSALIGVLGFVITALGIGLLLRGRHG